MNVARSNVIHHRKNEVAVRKKEVVDASNEDVDRKNELHHRNNVNAVPKNAFVDQNNKRVVLMIVQPVPKSDALV